MKKKLNLWTLFWNQIGAVGDVEEVEDPMEGQGADEPEPLTDEEREILGGEEGPEDKGEEDEVEEQDPEGDDTKKPNPKQVDKWEKRASELTAKQRQAEEKLNLLKTNPDEYYRKYPDEKPASKEPPEPKPQISDTVDDPSQLVYRHDGHKYNGMTLGEIYEENPAFAQKIQLDYTLSQKQKADAERQTVEQEKEARVKEVSTFASTVSKELFGNEDVNAISDEEYQKVEGVLQEVFKYMADRKIGHLDDAYYLMTRDTSLQKASSDGARGALNSLMKGAVPTVRTGGDGAASTGFERYEGMTRDELADAIDKMSEQQYKIFIKKAPTALRMKHPDVFD